MPLPPAPTRRADRLSAAATSSTPLVGPRPVNKGPKIQDAQKPLEKPKTGRALAAVKSTKPSKLFVLDTNVLLHDPMSLFQFQENDVYLPMVVLEELDAHKKGHAEVARNGRQVSRFLDALTNAARHNLNGGLPLNATGHKQARGRLLFQTEALDTALPSELPSSKADNQILGVVKALMAKHQMSRPVVLVSKDINMRVKAAALGLVAEDYENDKVLDDADVMYTGTVQLPQTFWQKQRHVESWVDKEQTHYRVKGKISDAPLFINQFVHQDTVGETPLHARVAKIQGDEVELVVLKDFTSQKNAVLGVPMRNREQNAAMNLLMDPSIDFVTLTGSAGTGKTLMALAAGLSQISESRYTEIIMTRATVSVGEDIGFLPGTEEEKMGPWMGALDDNLEFLSRGGNAPGHYGRSDAMTNMREKIKIKSMGFMRGRTFMKKWVIIDEAQNLTPKQMKTLITRAGPGTKIVCMGNLAQIDTPYLTEGSSGLSYVVDRFKGWAHYGHITLARGERSRLADFANVAL